MPLRLLGLGLIEDKVIVLRHVAVVLKWNCLNTWLTSDQARGRLSANSALAVAGSGTHADDGSIGPAEGAGSAGVHNVILKMVHGVLLLLKAAPVADWVETTWVDNLIESKHAELGVVLDIVWVG